MQTLAGLKRTITVGLTFHCTNYIHPHRSGERTVMEVQTNGFWCIAPNVPMPIWTQYPPTKLLSFDGQTVTFWRETGKACEPAFMFDFTPREEE